MASGKYPRTLHLPFSPGKGCDDKVLDSAEHFSNIPLIITEKLDGSNVMLNSQDCFARSHSAKPGHESFDYIKAIHAGLKYNIPDGYDIFGEWLYAKHSIVYSRLPSYLLVFAIRTDASWLSWKDTEYIAKELKLNTVPVLYRNIIIPDQAGLEKLILDEMKIPSLFGEEKEGCVVRIVENFTNFQASVAKFVRKDHVQTNDHWKSQQIIKNGLIDGRQ